MATAREPWLELARKTDWTFSYVSEREVFPPEIAGEPWLPHTEWVGWDEPFRTTYAEYVTQQAAKNTAVEAVRQALGRIADMGDLDPAWVNGMKLHSALLPLAEFAATVGNLRATRFARDSAWRHTANFGALDECRHTQIPLGLMHGLVPWDPQFDWTHRFYHTTNWVSIAARHVFDELLLTADPIEFAVATNFVFETGFTNLQFVGLSALAHRVKDRMVQTMLQSIQTDEARHAQIGPAVLGIVARHDPERAQRWLDKWFWRSWHLFAIATGFTMDYLTPVHLRTRSFKEFMEEWVIDQYIESLAQFGLQKPWYWDTFLESLDYYHHMVYASAYSYRATVWFDMVVPSPDDRAWLHRKYPASWSAMEPVWARISERWRETDPGVDFGVHATAIPAFCDLCQIVLCGGTPSANTAMTEVIEGRHHVFCSEPCRRIYLAEPQRYGAHKNIVKRVLAGEAPGNLIEFLTRYSSLDEETWGRDVCHGDYPWLDRGGKRC